MAARPDVPGSGAHIKTPVANQLKLPSALLQGMASASPVAAPIAGSDAVTVGLTSQIAQPAVQALPPLLLQQTSSAPLMQQVLQRQQHWQQEPSSTSKQQDSSSSDRNGKRRGYCIDPDALRRTLEKQLQKQRWEQEQAQLRQQQAEQQALLQQQQQQLLEALAQQQQQHMQQQQTALPNQQLQQLQWQQHRQRNATRLSQGSKQRTERPAPAQAAARLARCDQHSSVCADLQPAAPSTSTVYATMQKPLRLQHDNLDISISMETLAQGPAFGQLDSSQGFGSAKKRLRLSICDEEHHSSSLVASAGGLQLSEALVSPCVLPALAVKLENPAMPAAVGVAAASAGRLEPDALPTPSTFFAAGPSTAESPPGASTSAPTCAAGAYATPVGVFAASSSDLASISALVMCKQIAARTANVPPAKVAPSVPVAAPGKLNNRSPIAADVGISAAAGIASPATVGTSACADITFITPSKFLICSPASADKQAGRPRQETPLTPVLFGHPASPWSIQTQTQQRDQKGAAASSDPLRAARRPSIDGIGQPSSWVPVIEHSHNVQRPGPHDAAATPAAAHVRVGLFCTPSTASAAAVGMGRCGSDCDVVLDPAAAAAVPVDIESIACQRKPSAGAAMTAGESTPAGTQVGSSAAATSAAAGEKCLQAPAEAGGVSSELPALVCCGMAGSSLMTPPVQEQQVTATPLTQVV